MQVSCHVKELGDDLRVSKQLAKELNKQIDDWRVEQSKVVNIKPSGKVTDLINFYYSSNDFNMLRDSTKVDYRYFSDHSTSDNWLS